MTLVNGAMAIGAGHCKHLPSSDGLTVGLNEGANTVKFYTFRWEGQVRLGAATDGGRLVDLASARQMRGEGVLPAYRNMQSLIESESAGLDATHEILQNPPEDATKPIDSLTLTAPLRPLKIWSYSIYADHLRGAGGGMAKLMQEGLSEEQRKRVSEVLEKMGAGGAEFPPPAYYENPPYYCPDVMALTGHDSTVEWPAYSNWIDYELELVAVIGKRGKDISADTATTHIFGYTILNDLSARDAQMAAMAVAGLPGKGKDFDNSNPMGPCIVTADEIPDPFAMKVTARVNGEVWASRVAGQPDHTYAGIIAHATQSQTIMPGEAFSTGCVAGFSATEVGRKLSRGDVVELEADRIGVLRTHIV